MGGHTALATRGRPLSLRIVVTGAASGIGRRTAVRAAAAGHDVVLVARSPARADDAVGEARARLPGRGSVSLVAVDLTRLADVRRAADEIAGGGTVDALVNNAAVFDLARDEPRLTPDGIEETFAVNHVAAAALALGLRSSLSPGGVVVTAGTKGLLALPRLRLDPHDPDSRASYGPTVAYYRSKVAQLAFTVELARRGVPAVAVRIPSTRVDPEKLRRQPRHLRLAYQAKSRVASHPDVVATAYLRAARPAGAVDARHVDERGRTHGWPNASAGARLGAWCWKLTRELIDAV